MAPELPLTFHSYYHQTFCIPSPIIRYILINPSSPTVYNKLVNSCKYFFAKNPILLLNELYFEEDYDNEGSGKTYGLYFNCENYQKFVLNFNAAKFWLINYFFIHENSFTASNLAATISSKLYQSDVCRLGLHGQGLTWKEFLLLSRNVGDIWMRDVVIINEKNEHVLIEIIFEHLPKIVDFGYDFCNDSRVLSKNSFKNIIELPHFKNTCRLDLYHIPVRCDIQSLMDYVKKNQRPITFLILSSPDYREYFETILNSYSSDDNNFVKNVQVRLHDFCWIDDKKTNRKVKNYFYD